MASVNFFGKEAVLAAFREWDVDVWAIAEGRDILNKGDSEASLTKYLTMLQNGNTLATYKLMGYNNIEPEDVTAKTEPSSGFRFKLGNESPYGMQRSGDDLLMKRLDDIEKKLNGSDEDDEDETISGIVKGYLKNPAQLIQIIGAVKSFFTSQPLAGFSPAAAIGKVADSTLTPMDPQEALQRIGNAIDKLQVHDPQIVQHLEKLASLAEKNPQLFKMLIGNLDAL